jgi:glycosyltransferase involved in cell wall biosynthesis
MTAPMTMDQSKGRLAFVLPHMTGGGAERVALRLMQDFVAQGHPVDLILMTRYGQLLELLPPEVRVIDCGGTRLWHVFGPLRRYLATTDVAGVQAFMWPLTVVATLAHRAAHSKAGLVLSDHTTLSRQYGHFGKLKRLMLRASIRAVYPLAAARVAVSESAADDLSAVSGIARGKTTVIYNPVDRPREVAADTPRFAPPWSPGAKRILTVGNLKPEKNHLGLIVAFELLLREIDAQLIIVGEGDLRDEIEDHIRDRGLTGKVLLPGFYLDPWPF